MATCTAKRTISLKIESDYFKALPFELTCSLEADHRGSMSSVDSKEGKPTNHRMVIDGVAAVYWQEEEVKR